MRKKKRSAVSIPHIINELSSDWYGILIANGLLPCPLLVAEDDPKSGSDFNRSQERDIYQLLWAIRYLHTLRLCSIPDLKNAENGKVEKGITVFNKLCYASLAVLDSANTIGEQCYASKCVFDFLIANKLKTSAEEMHSALALMMVFTKKANHDKNAPLARYVYSTDPYMVFCPELVIGEQLYNLREWMPYVEAVPALQQWFDYLKGAEAGCSLISH